MAIRLDGEQVRMCIYIGEHDTWEGRPLAEAIMEKLRSMGTAGATVFKGALGFGRNAHVHAGDGPLDISEEAPIVIQIVDTQPNISLIASKLDAMIEDGLVTTEKVNVVMYRASDSKRKPRIKA